MVKQTAIEVLKAYAFEPHRLPIPGEVLIRMWAEDKGYRVQDIKTLVGLKWFPLGFSMYILRNNSDENVTLVNYLARTMTHEPSDSAYGLQKYHGSSQQNSQIDSAFFTRTTITNGFFADGAADYFRIADNSNTKIPANARDVPICVIGAGPSGMMVVRCLQTMGFVKLTIIDQKGIKGGIWNQDNVKRSRNNPRSLDFTGLELPAAPGDGAAVRNLAVNGTASSITNAVVNRIHPDGNFNHRVVFTKDGTKEQQELTFPIVINCMGIGKPKAPHDGHRVATQSTLTQSGIRWQQTLPADFNKKRMVFIGLGNSTAEMLLQIQQLREKGAEIDYRVLTHYPKDAVERPFETVEGKSGNNVRRNFRVFRDLSKPDLISYAGDLPELRRAYYSALREGNIISDVRSWRVLSNSIVASTRDRDTTSFQYDTGQLYSLIGYRWPNEQYSDSGINVQYDPFGDPVPGVDYDGEYQDLHGNAAASKNYSANARLHRGYFGLGPAIETPTNRNATVIPGNIFRMGDLAMSVVLRAMEYANIQK